MRHAAVLRWRYRRVTMLCYALVAPALQAVVCPCPGSMPADYDALPLEHRVSMLGTLCHLAMDSPSIRQDAA